MRDDHGNTVRTARAAQLSREAQAGNLETIDRLLNSPAGIAALPPLFQAEPRKAITERLGQLARQVSNLPDSDQPARFSALLDRAQALGAEGGRALTYIAVHVGALTEQARHHALCDVANRLKLLPMDHPARSLAPLMLSRSIPHLPEENRSEATRQIVEVLRPLPSDKREFVLARPDDQLSPAIKDALRQALAEDSATSLSRAGASARA